MTRTSRSLAGLAGGVVLTVAITTPAAAADHTANQAVLDQAGYGGQHRAFTAAVVLQLVDEGRVELDAPVDGNVITVRQLLQHTSGLPRDVGYLVLGMLIEQHTGQPAGDAITERIIEPLGLTGATATDLATFYRALVDGRLVSGATLAEMRRTLPSTSDSPAEYGLGLISLVTNSSVTGATPSAVEVTKSALCEGADATLGISG